MRGHVSHGEQKKLEIYTLSSLIITKKTCFFFYFYAISFSCQTLGARIDLKKELEFLLWLASSIEIVQKLFKFDYVCLNFLNKTSGQTWG